MLKYETNPSTRFHFITDSNETGKLSLFKTVKVVYRYKKYIDIKNKTVITEKQSQS